MIVIRMRVRHALMNMSGFAVRMSCMLDLRRARQAMSEGATCKRETDRRDKAKGIKRDENARSLYPHDPAQLRQHPEPAPQRDYAAANKTSNTVGVWNRQDAPKSQQCQSLRFCLISHSGSGLRRCMAGLIWTKAFGRRSK